MACSGPSPSDGSAALVRRLPYARLRPDNMVRHLRELLSFRDFVVNPVVRELKARYKRSVLGFLWTPLNPLRMMLVFTIVFAVLMRNNQIPNYPLFLLCGLLHWNFFSAGVMVSINSIVGNGHLVEKVYFPREVMPLSSVMASLVAAYRELLYWGYRTNLDFLFRTAVTSLVVLAFGYWFFVRYRDRFGERI